MCGSMVDIQSEAAEIRREKKKEEERNHGKNIMACPVPQGGDENDRTMKLIAVCTCGSLSNCLMTPGSSVCLGTVNETCG